MLKKKILAAAASAAQTAATLNVATTCAFITYQPPLPPALRRQKG